MALTQESILSLLVSEGGRVKKSDLVLRFGGFLDSADPAEKQRNRELFRTFVNNVAVVKEADADRYVVLKKTYQHLLRSEAGGSPPPGERQVGPEPLSLVEVALQRARWSDVRVKRKLDVSILKPEPAASQVKPHGLPVRLPPSTSRAESLEPQVDPRDSPGAPKPDPCEKKRASRCSEEPRDARDAATVPLEPLEHEWLVKCASGLWTQVYGLLLRDQQLVQKRDFISGFTALHWAAKWGNGEMLVKIMDVSRRAGVPVDVNARSHGGHTPLHVAALHHQDYVMAMLVGEFGASVSVRDNGGRKACHYLHPDASRTLREMMAGPAAPLARDGASHEKEEPDLVLDPSKGRHTVSRLFQPHATGQKKRDKQRPGLYSLTSEPGEERDDQSSGCRPRVTSETFR